MVAEKTLGLAQKVICRVLEQKRNAWWPITASRLQKELFMLRAICNYLRGCWCKHDFELLAKVEVQNELGEISHRNTYRCRKCGFVQRVRL